MARGLQPMPSFGCERCGIQFKSPIARRSHTCTQTTPAAAPAATPAAAPQILQAAALFQQGHAAARSGQHREAGLLYLQCLALNPEHADAHLNLGSTLYNHRGDAAAALSHFESASRLQPQSATPLINLGIMWHESFGQPQKALPLVARALELDPNTSFTHHVICAALYAPCSRCAWCS